MDNTRLPKHALNCKPRGRRTVNTLGNDGNASMPEQVKRPNPWRKMMMMMMTCNRPLRLLSLFGIKTQRLNFSYTWYTPQLLFTHLYVTYSIDHHGTLCVRRIVCTFQSYYTTNCSVSLCCPSLSTAEAAENVTPFCSPELHLQHVVSVQLVEALRYKPEGRRFNSRWFHRNFSLT